jgi:prepilin-type N-terminal cleavage/methylation domain-containing protein
LTESRLGRWKRRGFTVLEVMVVSGLMALLALLLGKTWYGLVKPTAELAARGRIDQEIGLAAAALTRDLGGSLADPPGRLGPQILYRRVGRLQPGNSQLWLCFDGGDPPNNEADWGPPDVVIVYEVDGDSLVRRDQSNDTTFVVARLVNQMEVLDLGDRVQIRLTFSYRGVTRTYTMVARNS